MSMKRELRAHILSSLGYHSSFLHLPPYLGIHSIFLLHGSHSCPFTTKQRCKGVESRSRRGIPKKGKNAVRPTGAYLSHVLQSSWNVRYEGNEIVTNNNDLYLTIMMHQSIGEFDIDLKDWLSRDLVINDFYMNENEWNFPSRLWTSFDS